MARPSRRFEIAAIPFDGGWRGVFAAPGLEVSMVSGRDGAPTQHATEEAALVAAAKALCQAMNMRPVFRSKAGHRRLSGNDFAVALAEANLSPSHFCRLTGSIQDRVMSWIDGAEAVPHWAHILVKILANNPNARTLAEAVSTAALAEAGNL